jgi:crotonobetainyl-CoA:carnitine CoA-transferase CaiB-like acyl-CoA transferase
MYATVGILAALRHRDQSGEGQYIDLSLYDTQVAWLINAATNHLVSGKIPHRIGNRHPSIAPYQTFPTADGTIAIAVGNDQQFARFCAAIDLVHLAGDIRFQRNRDRVQNIEALDVVISERLRAETTRHWEYAFTAAQVPAGPVATIDEVVAHPQTAAREMLVSMPVGDVPGLRLVGNPLKMSATPVQYGRSPPHLDQDRDEILSELDALVRISTN